MVERRRFLSVVVPIVVICSGLFSPASAKDEVMPVSCTHPSIYFAEALLERSLDELESFDENREISLPPIDELYDSFDIFNETRGGFQSAELIFTLPHGRLTTKTGQPLKVVNGNRSERFDSFGALNPPSIKVTLKGGDLYAADGGDTGEDYCRLKVSYNWKFYNLSSEQIVFDQRLKKTRELWFVGDLVFKSLKKARIYWNRVKHRYTGRLPSPDESDIYLDFRPEIEE